MYVFVYVCVCVCVCTCVCRVCVCVRVCVILCVLFCRILLTRYLAETMENSSLAGTIVISATWDGVESMRGLECFPNRKLYSRPVAHRLRERVQMSVATLTNRLHIELCLFL